MNTPETEPPATSGDHDDARRQAAGAGTATTRARVAGDISGAFADLGTFLPLVLGILAVGHASAASVLTGFGFFALATAAIYRRPVPVQPMKAVAAIVIATGLSAETMAASGIVLGILLIALAMTGTMERLNRAVPQSVLSGVSIGVGLNLAYAGLGLIGRDWVVGIAILALVMLMLRTRLAGFACLAGLVAALAVGLAGGAASGLDIAPGLTLPGLVLPSPAAFGEAALGVVVPQTMLTIANAVLATAALAAVYFPADAGANITPRRLALSTGWLNLLLAPFGALPMCHGAGGLVAQHRFGARTGLAPALFGGACLGLGLFVGGGAVAVLALVPLAGLGAMLAVAGGEMVMNKRLFDGRPDCLAVILVTAGLCVLVNVAVAAAAGMAAEVVRARAMRRLGGSQEPER